MKKLPNPFTAELRRAADAVIAGNKFLLAGHLNPDGDTLGSSLAMASVLKRMGKRVYIYSSDPVPANLMFMPGIKSIHAGKLPSGSFDTVILLECSTPERAGDLKGIHTKAKCLINIDHHRTSVNYGDINLIDSLYSSTAELVYQLLYVMSVKITPQEATCLYVGIVTDTGRFHYPATRPNTLTTAAHLLEAGADSVKANDRIYTTKSLPAIKLLGRALNKIEILDSGKSVVTVLTNSDFTECAAQSQHTEDIVNYGLMIPGVKISALFREEQDRVTVNFRSKGNLDVSALAKKFGGGGHRNAAGCKIKAPFQKVREDVLQAVSQIYKYKS